jgi:hypothetical protein
MQYLLPLLEGPYLSLDSSTSLPLFLSVVERREDPPRAHVRTLET